MEWSLFGEMTEKNFRKECSPENLRKEYLEYLEEFDWIEETFTLRDFIQLKQAIAISVLAGAITDAPEFLVHQLLISGDVFGTCDIADAINGLANTIE